VRQTTTESDERVVQQRYCWPVSKFPAFRLTSRPLRRDPGSISESEADDVHGDSHTGGWERRSHSSVGRPWRISRRASQAHVRVLDRCRPPHPLRHLAAGRGCTGRAGNHFSRSRHLPFRLAQTATRGRAGALPRPQSVAAPCTASRERPVSRVPHPGRVRASRGGRRGVDAGPAYPSARGSCRD
jgi:hypothetical protein